MKATRKTAGDKWQFDGWTITVRIPMAWKRRGGRKVIIAPDGGDAWAPAKPRTDSTLIRALVRAHRWNRLLRLTLLAPDISRPVVSTLERFGGRLPRQPGDGQPSIKVLDRRAAEPVAQGLALFGRGAVISVSLGSRGVYPHYFLCSTPSPKRYPA